MRALQRSHPSLHGGRQNEESDPAGRSVLLERLRRKGPQAVSDRKVLPAAEWPIRSACAGQFHELFAAGGFAVTNLNAGVEARAERETPAMRDLRTQIASLEKSIAGECSKRGDRCQDLERQRAEANAKLGIERASLKADADPQAAALGISSPTLHLVQAGAMVALCLFSGLFISFGAGLIWPR
jgi:hypothetical protein